MIDPMEVPGMLDFLDQQGNDFVGPWVSDEDKENAGARLGDVLIMIFKLGYHMGHAAVERPERK